MRISNFSFKNGFTLIELMVVISIISILASILYASFSDARTTAKNKTVRSELREVQLALELYKSQKGVYPTTPMHDYIPDIPPPGYDGNVRCQSDSSETNAESSSRSCNFPTVTYQYIGDTSFAAGAKNEFIPEYISELPSYKLSANSDCDIIYMTDNTNPSWYKLKAVQCHESTTDGPDGGVRPSDEFALCPVTCGACGSISNFGEDSFTDPAVYESYAVYSDGAWCK